MRRTYREHLKHSNAKGFATLYVVLVMIAVLLVAGTGWIVWNATRAANRSLDNQANSNTGNFGGKPIANFDECVAAGNPVAESYPETCRAGGKTFVNEKQADNDAWSTTATSGNGAFEITLPDGFGEVIKPLDSDSFYLMGTDQPEIKAGGPIEIKELDSFGTDAPVLFAAVILDGDYDRPQGRISDYTLVNGKENSIAGKKYTLIYGEDEPEGEGIGQRRLEDDRDYTYLFNLPNGKTLLISYHVYATDPGNMVETIEAIIDTIRLK
jgi:hypothetical protein